MSYYCRTTVYESTSKSFAFRGDAERRINISQKQLSESELSQLFL